jgi:hypothetical protein
MHTCVGLMFVVFMVMQFQYFCVNNQAVDILTVGNLDVDKRTQYRKITNAASTYASGVLRMLELDINYGGSQDELAAICTKIRPRIHLGFSTYACFSSM